MKPSTMLEIRVALETAGVEFIPENGGGAVARLRHPTFEDPSSGSGTLLARASKGNA